jgi:hypothetical protein
MRSMLVRLERIMLMWVLIILLLPFNVYLLIFVALLDSSDPKTDITCFMRDWFSRLTYSLNRAKVASRVPISPTIVDMTSTMEGP